MKKKYKIINLVGVFLILIFSSFCFSVNSKEIVNANDYKFNQSTKK